MPKVIRISESALRDIIMESFKAYLKEGTNDGRGINISGLVAKTVTVEKVYEGKAYFTAVLSKGFCKWTAKSCDKQASSEEGVFNSEGDKIVEFSEDEKKIDGGVMKGFLYLVGLNKDENENAAEYIKKDVLTDFEVDLGYTESLPRVRLGSPVFNFTDFDIDGLYYTVHVDELKIKSRGVADSINWFFENCDKLDDIYPGDEYEPARKVRRQTRFL